MRQLEIRRLGVIGYDEALALQRTLVEARKADRIPDTLLLLEHPHVLTLGVRASKSVDGAREGRWPNVLASREQLLELGVAVHETGRGGDVTYHGPGQIVGYPIVDLRPDRQDVHRYVRDLEEVLIRACGDFGIDAHRIPGLTGAWVDHPAGAPEKVAAIGVRIARWITSHGFALNVNTALEYFDLIVPCGIADRGVTSFRARLGHPVEPALVEDRLVARFVEVFERHPVPASRVAS
jgi:lipoyl(octanoyl) transferase